MSIIPSEIYIYIFYISFIVLKRDIIQRAKWNDKEIEKEPKSQNRILLKVYKIVLWNSGMATKTYNFIRYFQRRLHCSEWYQHGQSSSGIHDVASEIRC